MLSIIIAHANLQWKTNGGFLRSYTVASSLASVILHACSEFCVRFWDCPLVCGRFGLWPFRFVAVPVCGRFGLWPFRSVAFPVCGPFGLWPFRFVAFSVCGRFGLWPFRLWPFRFLAVMTCYPWDDTGLLHTNTTILNTVLGCCLPIPWYLRWYRGVTCLYHDT